MRKIKRIYVHCSDSAWGTVEELRRWHMEPPRKWDDIGYHFVITNGYATYADKREGDYVEDQDGAVHVGRKVEWMGAHVKNDNPNTIGICLIGPPFTDRQLESLAEFAAKQLRAYGLPIEVLLGHREYWIKRNETPKRECPIIDMDAVRAAVVALNV